MSTLIDILPEIQDRMPAERAHVLLTVLNRAIALIHKRLYIIQSDLVKGQLDVHAYEEDTYTADSIAFVAGTEGVADTITDTANGFVTAGFVAGMNIGTDATGNAGPFTIATAAVGTLTLTGTGVVTAAAAGSDVAITSIDDYADLPADFLGLIDKPYVDGNTWTLEPIPNQETRIAYQSAGESIYYEVIGQKLYLTPPTSADITLKGWYWKKPTKIATPEETLPYNELFDDALVEILLQVMAGQTLTISQMDAFLTKAVDIVATKRQKKAPEQLPTGMNLDEFLT